MNFVPRHVLFAPMIAILVLSGCAQLPRPSVVGEQEKVAISQPPPAQPNGSLFQARRGYRPLFEDRRPVMVGDVLTVLLDEQVSASKSSQSNADRKGSAALTPTAVPKGLEDLNDYGFDLSGESGFQGGGGSQARNTFSGTITVTVLEVLGNGNLRVRGEKQILINQGTEFIRFSGVVDPKEISVGNRVTSTQVADARIEYVGDGYINEAQTMGWLQRFFLNISPF